MAADAHVTGPLADRADALSADLLGPEPRPGTLAEAGALLAEAARRERALRESLARHFHYVLRWHSAANRSVDAFPAFEDLDGDTRDSVYADADDALRSLSLPPEGWPRPLPEGVAAIVASHTRYRFSEPDGK